MRLTNYYEHAGDNRFMVYEFYLDSHADEFQGMLEEKNIVFEDGVELKKTACLFTID